MNATPEPRAAVHQRLPWDASDDVLLASARNGDMEAFARIFERHRASLYSTCVGVLRDSSSADDVVQETFLRGFRYLGTYDSGRGMWPWLMTIAVRECLRTLNRRGRDELIGDPAALGADAVRVRDLDPEETLKKVLRAQDLELINRALAGIPARQRRALLLYALEGWSYPEIAVAQGTSVGSVKSLIFRARAAVRERCELGLAGLLLPLRNLHARATRSSARARAVLGQIAAQPVFSVSSSNLGAGLLVLALTIGATASAESPASGSLPDPAAGVRVASATVPVRKDASTGTQRPASEVLLQRLTDPTKGVSPESTQYHSITPSPGYEQDGTIFALGRAIACWHEPCTVLFASTDGGASWTQTGPSFVAHTLVLPPTYPEDNRIFAMGPGGLQESRDGGATFTVVAPVVGGSAVSPAFGRGDPRILINGGPVLEYWADEGIVKPAKLATPSAMHTGAAFTTWQTVAFSPSYPAHEVVLVSGILPSGMTRWDAHQASVIYRCHGGTCETTRLEASVGLVSLALSPRFAMDDLAFAYRDDRIFRSADGGRSFDRLGLPGGFGEVMDLRVVESEGDVALYAAVRSKLRAPGGVYRSLDHGESWTALRIAVDGFQLGALRVAVAPDGRLFAGGVTGGMACSIDDGATWASRCPHI